MIHIQKKFKGIDLLNKKSIIEYEAFLKQQPLTPFDDDVINYLNALSKTLNQNPRSREYPEILTFAFFCRRANILQLKNKYISNDQVRLGRGMVFHIAPSNVAINFAFSLVAGLLSGNVNIVRVPSKEYEQIDIVAEAINMLQSNIEYSVVAKRLMLIRYDRSNSATGKFSLDCDVRVIWGGDDSIESIRRNPLKPRAFDVTFADRYSICVINADELVKVADLSRIALGFFNDTFLFDQNACTSPHLIVWLGSVENVSTCKELFWAEVRKIVIERYELQGTQAVDKLTNFYSHALQADEISYKNSGDNLIWRAELKNLSKDIENYRCTGGYFSEYHASGLSDLSNIINSKYQTLSYYGFTNIQLANFIDQLKPSGIDRIVPIGRTTDFSLIWDGFDITNTLSRRIDIL